MTEMRAIAATKVHVEDGKLHISTRFRKFTVERDEIIVFRVKRIPSFFNELGIELQCDRLFLVTERAVGFLDLAEFLNFEELFGSLWYRDAENGRELEYGSRSA